MIENPIIETVTLNNTNLYYEMITNQFIKEYLEESGRTQSTQARDSTLVYVSGNRHESAEIIVRDQQRTSLQGTEPFELSSQSSYNNDE
jgi:AICAR transformylase/IMP cyclohydrolase PurH